MAWTPIDGRGLTIPQLKSHIDSLPATLWASGMTLHNTGAPTLKDWNEQNAKQRIKNLEHYFKNKKGWNSAPHAFIDDNFIWLFTPFTKQGTHSPSWNGTKLGIEMVGDFRKGSDDDDSGRGLKVKKNTVALFAMLHTKYGWDPENIKLHKEDKKTNHDCPGDDISKEEFIDLVQEYMGHAGNHDIKELPIFDNPNPIVLPKLFGSVTVPANDFLNMRDKSSVSGKILVKLYEGNKVEILGSAMNGKTEWLRIEWGKKIGWVAARYIRKGVK